MTAKYVIVTGPDLACTIMPPWQWHELAWPIFAVYDASLTVGRLPTYIRLLACAGHEVFLGIKLSISSKEDWPLSGIEGSSESLSKLGPWIC